ncbi:hypothetical protein [Marinimicrobium alkaliphilum]|uniref:hypothetical protein n=1 Tax=Marinimicrobium alkaliphilum TaxID=2202654 RepID=UPI000DB965CB|nr:hypothetical protein [Marinimicrobium alkaliphilum]
MNWLERYTFAVKAHLPTDVRQDVADELLSDLLDERDHRAESLGRELTDDETKALLKERGHPLLVAANYQPRRALVSEELYPLFLLLLRWVIVAIAVVQIGLAAISVLNQPEQNIGQSIIHLSWNTLHASLYGFAWLTLIFYLFGEYINLTDFFKNWKPESLPRVTPQGEYISRTGSAIETVVTVYFFAWLNHIVPQSLFDNPVGLVFSEQWPSLLPWINAVIIASVTLSLSKLLFPYWTRRKIALDLCLYIPAVIILAIIYQWDNAIALHMNTEEGISQWDIGQGVIGPILAGYILVASVDSVRKLRKFRAMKRE